MIGIFVRQMKSIPFDMGFVVSSVEQSTTKNSPYLGSTVLQRISKTVMPQTHAFAFPATPHMGVLSLIITTGRGERETERVTGPASVY